MPTEIDFKDMKIDIIIDNLQIKIKHINYGIFTESFARHSHGKGYYELHLVCAGYGKLLLNNGEYALEKGTLYMTGPGILHEQLTDKQNPMHEYCMGFEITKEKKGTDTDFSKYLYETTFWLGKDNGECDRLFSSLSKECNNKLIGCSINMQSAISSILVELVRLYTGSRKEHSFAILVPDDRRMNIVDSYFLYNYQHLSEEELGILLSLSSRQVQRFLKKTYNKTFSEMKREAKLNKALEFLQEGMRMDDVAAMVGYNSTAFFRKQLKQHTSAVTCSSQNT